MEIYFRTRRLRRTFSSHRNLTREYGSRMARTIEMRMVFLRQAPTLSSVPTRPPQRRHMLSGERQGQFAIDLVHPFRLIIEPKHDPVPLLQDGGVDTTKISSVTIVEIVDYH